MRIKTFWERLKPRQQSRAVATDWTTGWSLRDLADLPAHHLRRDER